MDRFSRSPPEKARAKSRKEASRREFHRPEEGGAPGSPHEVAVRITREASPVQYLGARDRWDQRVDGGPIKLTPFSRARYQLRIQSRSARTMWKGSPRITFFSTTIWSGGWTDVALAQR